jgi:hypothetical protein
MNANVSPQFSLLLLAAVLCILACIIIVFAGVRLGHYFSIKDSVSGWDNTATVTTQPMLSHTATHETIKTTGTHKAEGETSSPEWMQWEARWKQHLPSDVYNEKPVAPPYLYSGSSSTRI